MCAWLPNLVVETELQLSIHGANLDGEDLAGLLPPEQAHLLVHADVDAPDVAFRPSRGGAASL